MKQINLRLSLIMLFHPNYHLVADNLCDISCLKGCTIRTSAFNHIEYHYCHSDNGNDFYLVPVYAKILSNDSMKIIRYKTEYYEMADELYQKILSGEYIPFEDKRKGLMYERKNSRSYR